MAQVSTVKSKSSAKRRLPPPRARKKAKRASPSVGAGIFDQLKADHRRIRELSKEILKVKDAGSEEALTLYRQLRETVLLHAKTEEEVFYDLLRVRSAEADDEKLHEDVLEGYEEHHVARLLMGEIDDTPNDSEHWLAKVTVLTEVLRHHIEEEEEEMFKGARKELDRDEIRDLGTQFVRRKEGVTETIVEEEEIGVSEEQIEM